MFSLNCNNLPIMVVNTKYSRNTQTHAADGVTKR